jgi:hypothetical protein
MTKILLLKGRLQWVRQDFFFSAFADITAQLKSSGVYNLSELDLRDVIDYYAGMQPILRLGYYCSV